MRSTLPLAVIVLGLVMAQAAADEGWVLELHVNICALTRTDHDQEILVLHGRSPNEAIGELFHFSFRSPALPRIPAEEDEEVRLIFRQNDDPSHLEMRITSKQTSYDGLSVSTFALTVWMLDQLKSAGDFHIVDVEIRHAIVTFDVKGLSTSLPELLACARSAAN